MTRRRSSYRYPSYSDDSYRIAPPLPYRRRTTHRTKPRVDPAWDRDCASADSYRVAPKPKPWKSRSRRGHERGQRPGHETQEPRAHSKPKSERKSKRPKNEFHPDIKNNPFFKDIFEGPKVPKVRKMQQAPPTPQVQRIHKPSKQHIPAAPNRPLPAVSKPPINPPNIRKKSAAKAATTKPKNQPLRGFHSGVSPPVPQFPQPQYPAGQSATPLHQQPPRSAPRAAQVPGNVAAPHQQGPVYNAAVSGQPPPFQTPPPAAETANQALKRLREYYSQPQFQSTTKWGVPATPQGIDPYPSPITGNQVPNHMNRYLISSNAEAQAKHEKAQDDLAAANVAYEQAMERLAALQAKGPDVPAAQAPSSHHRAASAKPHVSVIEELEHNAPEAAREADEAARVAGIKMRGRAPKRVSVAPGHVEIPRYQPAHFREDTSDAEKRSQDRYRAWRERQEDPGYNEPYRSQHRVHEYDRTGRPYDTGYNPSYYIGDERGDGHNRYYDNRDHLSRNDYDGRGDRHGRNWY